MDTADLFATTAAPLRAVIVTSRSCSTSKMQIQEIRRETAIARLVANNYLEVATSAEHLLGPAPTAFARFLDAYAMVYPDSRPAVFWKEFAAALLKSLDGVPCYELVMPTAYDEDVPNQVRRVINGI